MRITKAFMASKLLFLIASSFLAIETALAAESLVPICAGTLNVGSFRLLVTPASGGTPLPLHDVNILEPGEKLKYEPVHIAPAIKDKAKIALLLVPTDTVKAHKDSKDSDEEKKHEKNGDDLEILPAHPAKDPGEWPVPKRSAVVGMVFGPHGLDVKKVSSLVEKNPELISELTEYAEQTAKVEALVELLTEYQQAPDTSRSLEAALQGFSAQYNVAVPKLDTSASTTQQAAQMLSAVSPSMQSYDPLTAPSTAMVSQTSGLAGSVAMLFFGTPVGVAAGSTGLFLNLHSMLFPNNDFRSAFTQSMGTKGVALCAKAEAEKARTRVAYLWMMRVPDVPAPPVALAETAYVPAGTKSTLKVPFSTPEQARLLPRAHAWELVSGEHHTEVPTKVTVGPAGDSLELDLTKAKLAPGEYHLAAMWDWTPMEVHGTVDVRPLADVSKVKLAQESADHLIENSGTVKAQLRGTDFEFVETIAITKIGDRKSAPKDVPFTLPKGKAMGNQETLEAEFDTSALPAGRYELAMTQTGGSTEKVPITVHPANPKFEDLPVRANLGETQQTITLHGTSLERLTRLTSSAATLELAPAPADAHNLKERHATVKLLPAAHQGDVASIDAFVEGIDAPLEIPDALRVAGPRPKITGMSRSFAQEPDVVLQQGEIPAGTAASFALRGEGLETRPLLGLTCANEGFVKQPVALHSGEKNGTIQLDFAGQGLLFLSLDPGLVGQSGCQLTATVTSESTGESDPFTLGRIIRLPRLAKFSLTDQKVGDLYLGHLVGRDLETIEKTGWDAKTGYPVQGIPAPVPGSPQEQTLDVALPWPPPSPHAPIYVWLRGETEGRLTDAKY